MSQKTGVAPASKTALAVAIKVKFGTITSSPIPMFKDFKQQNIAAVPLHTAIACFAPVNSLTLLSNSLVKVCSVTYVESITDFK